MAQSPSCCSRSARKERSCCCTYPEEESPKEEQRGTGQGCFLLVLFIFVEVTHINCFQERADIKWVKTRVERARNLTQANPRLGAVHGFCAGCSVSVHFWEHVGLDAENFSSEHGSTEQFLWVECDQCHLKWCGACKNFVTLHKNVCRIKKPRI